MKNLRVVYLADCTAFRSTIAAWFMQEWGERYKKRSLDDWINTQTYPNKSKLPLTLVAIADKSEGIEKKSDEQAEVVGTVCLRQAGMTTHSDWRAWLSYLVVPEKHRGQGIAKRLLDAADSEAKKLGISELHLFTRLKVPTLYAAKGWVKVGREDYRGGPVIVMAKKLGPTLGYETSSPRLLKEAAAKAAALTAAPAPAPAPAPASGIK